ncbi:MAG: penicillin acylase family protein, partial [Gemmatimonadales bacterium]
AYGSLDVPYGEVMRLRYGGKDLPGNGGDNGGLFRVANYMPDEDGKFRIVGGDTYYQAVELGKPVRAKVLLAYGNATQPGSKYIGDQLDLFAAKQMRDAWLTRADVEANLDAREELPPATSAGPAGR